LLIGSRIGLETNTMIVLGLRFLNPRILKMEEVLEEMQTTGMGWCRREKKMTQHISTLSPTGYWVCTLCRCRCSELNPPPEAKKINHLKLVYV
jgi:hypothetical protein